MTWGRWIIFSSVALGLVVAACSSSDTTPAPATGGSGGATGGAAGTATGGAAGTATGGAAGTATGGAAGTATGGAAGTATGGAAGTATGGAAGEAGTAGAAGTAGGAGTAGAAGATQCPGGTGPKASHTDCMGTEGIGHYPGKEEAKTNCAGCHTADLGKASGNTNCWKCHNPTSATNLHDLTKGGKLHKAGASSVNSKDPKCVKCHAADQQGMAPCTPCHT